METTLHLQPLKTEVLTVSGRPVFHVNGKPHHGFFSSAPAPYMSTVLAAGFDIVDTHPQTPLGWDAPSVYDYADTDRRVESYLKQSPDALIIARFWLGYPNEQEQHGAPYWWAEANPDECVKPLAVSEGEVMPWDDLNASASWNQLIGASIDPSSAAQEKKQPPARPSFASLKFREEAGEALRRVIAHLEEKYGNRIAGYVVGGGPCGEWFHWNADEASRLDYSPLMVAHTRRYLRGKYGNIAALNAAWGAHYAGFDEIEMPSPPARFRPAFGNLRSTASERGVVDFYEAYHLANAETLLHWSAQAKAGCARNKVVMVFYGYLWNHNYGDSQARSGHAHLSKVLASPDVDMLVAPFCYSLRQMEGVITGQSVAGSARRNGKLYVHELDGSTSVKPCWNCPDHHNPQTAAESGELLRREMNKMLCEGSAGWYMDLRGGYFDSAAEIAELRRTLSAGIAARDAAGVPDAQVAVVLDPRAPFFFREGEPLLSPLVDAFKQHSLAKMGLGFDDLTLDDLAGMSASESARYRFWIFPCAVNLEPEQLACIRRHVFRNGNHVLWNYAANVCGSPDLGGMEAVTGFRCAASSEPGELSVTVSGGAHEWVKNLARPFSYGTRGDLSPDEIKYHAVLRLYADSRRGFKITPRFSIVSGGEPLGVMPDLPGSPCGLAVKPMDGWVSVLSCAPLLPPLMLGKIARSAGCHVFTDFPGQITQCQNHVGLFTHADGDCELRLPRPSPEIRELYTGAVLARHSDRVTIAARKNTALFIRY